VYKLDDNGSNSLSPNEFHYTKGTGPAQLTAIETGGLSNNDGLQVFGTNYSGLDHYFVKSYFNGISGCNEVIDEMAVHPGPDSVLTPDINISDFLETCPWKFSLVTSNLTTLDNALCYTTSIPTGDNSRPLPAGVRENKISSDFSIFPNPVIKSASIKLHASDSEKIILELYNSLGQKLYSAIIDTEQSELIINMKDLNLSAGVYMLRVNIDGETNGKKFIYIGE
jgi:hypothetical protein